MQSLLTQLMAGRGGHWPNGDTNGTLKQCDVVWRDSGSRVRGPGAQRAQRKGVLIWGRKGSTGASVDLKMSLALTCPEGRVRRQREGWEAVGPVGRT